MARLALAAFLMALLAVSLMAAVPTQPPGGGEAAKLTLTGTLQTGVVAAGGETTGVVLTVGTQGKFELDIRDAALRKKADGLTGKQVTITGTLTIRQGVAVAQRRIITVDTLEEVPTATTRP